MRPNLASLMLPRPLLKAEVQAVGIHRIHQTDTARYTIPSLWEGHGTPRTIRIHAQHPSLPHQHTTEPEEMR